MVLSRTLGSSRIEQLRRSSVVYVTVASWAVVFALSMEGVFAGSASPNVTAFAAVLSTILTVLAISKRQDGAARLVLSMVVGLYPAILIYAAQGLPWQTDLHLFSLVALAILVPLCDGRAVVVGCCVALLHHVVLATANPPWGFGGETSMTRVFLHVAALGVGSMVLCFASAQMRRALNYVTELEQRSSGQAERIRETKHTLEAAKAELTAERANLKRVHTDLSDERHTANKKLAARFETSVNTIAHSVASTVRLLHSSAEALKELAEAAVTESNDILGSAQTTSKAVNTVAAGVAELSMSIAEIAANASQQSQLADRANDHSDGGVRAITLLTDQSRTIGEATRAIVRIAERTNLLSLNAAIEAASAGPAGRGFSIVANEVKQLADSAAVSATEIEKFLKGVQSGTLEVELSFRDIDSAVEELSQAARAICIDVESQTQSADTIEHFARSAAGQADAMVERMQNLGSRANKAVLLSDELQRVAAVLSDNMKNLEDSTQRFNAGLKAS